MWIALAIMTTESIVSLIPVLTSFISRPSSSEVETDEDHEDDEPPSRLVPVKWALWGLILSGVGGTILIRILFGPNGFHIPAGLVGFVLAAVLSLLGYVSPPSHLSFRY